MGTRGAVCLVAGNTEKTIYNHYDSYPDHLGENALAWLRKVLAVELGEEAARESVQALRPVPEADPTADDFVRLAEFHDPQVSTGRDWYSLLRHAQGDLSATLRAGLYEDAGDFPRDSLFCEWAYVVDFDARRFEVYQGFQTSPPTEGRWVGQPGSGQGRFSAKYFPVQRIAAWSFDELPEDLTGLIVNEDED